MKGAIYSIPCKDCEKTYIGQKKTAIRNTVKGTQTEALSQSQPWLKLVTSQFVVHAAEAGLASPKNDCGGHQLVSPICVAMAVRGVWAEHEQKKSTLRGMLQNK